MEGGATEVQEMEEVLMRAGLLALQKAVGESNLLEFPKRLLRQNMFEKMFGEKQMEVIDFNSGDVSAAAPDAKSLSLQQLLYIRCKNLDGGATMNNRAIAEFLSAVAAAVGPKLVERLECSLEGGAAIDQQEEVTRLVLLIYGAHCQLPTAASSEHWLLRSGGIDAVLHLPTCSLRPASALQAPTWAHSNLSRASNGNVVSSRRKVHWEVELCDQPAAFQEKVAPSAVEQRKAARGGGAGPSFKEKMAQAAARRTAVSQEEEQLANPAFASPEAVKLRAQVEALLSELEASRAEVGELGEQLDESTSEAAGLQNELEAYRIDIEALRKELEGSKESIAKVTEELAAAKTAAEKAATELKEALESKEETAAKFKEELDAAKSAAEKAEIALKEAEASKSDASVVQKELDEAKEAVAKLKEELDAAKAAAEKSVNELKEAEASKADVSVVQKELDETKEATTKLKEELDAAKAAAEKAETALKEAEASKPDVVVVQKELDEAKEAAAKFKEDLGVVSKAAAAENAETALKEAEAYKADASAVQKELVEAKEAVAKLKEELEVAKAAAEKAETALTKSEGSKPDAAAVQKELDEAKEAMARLMEELAGAKAAAETAAPEKDIDEHKEGDSKVKEELAASRAAAEKLEKDLGSMRLEHAAVKEQATKEADSGRSKVEAAEEAAGERESELASLRKVAEAAKAQTSSAGATAAAAETAAAPASPTEGVQAAVRRVAAELGAGPKVCILGGTTFNDPTSEALVQSLAQLLSQRLNDAACLVTGGMDGVQRTFARHCGEDCCRLFNLMPLGQASGYEQGRDVCAGRDLEERKEVFGLLGDVYITVEGGPGVAHEARVAASRGALVVPLRRTGGASEGMFDFPAAALQRPSCATEEQWELLGNKDAPVDAVAAAVVAIVLCAVSGDSGTPSGTPTGGTLPFRPPERFSGAVPAGAAEVVDPGSPASPSLAAGLGTPPGTPPRRLSSADDDGDGGDVLGVPRAPDPDTPLAHSDDDDAASWSSARSDTGSPERPRLPAGADR